jgi:hypothetical protein
LKNLKSKKRADIHFNSENFTVNESFCFMSFINNDSETTIQGVEHD